MKRTWKGVWKRLVVGTVCATMIGGLMPGLNLNAKADEGVQRDLGVGTEYPLWVGGVQFTSEKLTIDNNDDQAFEGSAQYIPDSNTLVLSGFNNGKKVKSDMRSAIFYKGTSQTGKFTVILEGANTIEMDSFSAVCYGFQIQSSDTVVFKEGSTPGGSLTIASGDTSASNSYGIFTTGTIEIESGSVVAKAGKTPQGSSIGVHSGGDGVYVIRKGSLKAEGGEAQNLSYGIDAEYGDIQIKGEEVSVTATGGKAGISYGMFAGHEIHAAGATVIANGGPAFEYASTSVQGATVISKSYGAYANGVKRSVDMGDTTWAYADGETVDDYAGAVLGAAGGPVETTTGVVIETVKSFTATGSTKAVGDKLVNFVDGYGWTDVEGNEGKTEIAVSQSARSLETDYKKVQFPKDAAPVLTAPKITTESPLPDGTVDTEYSQKLEATGSATIKWSCANGLPEGLALSEAGVISGTPKKDGTFKFTVSAKNDAGEDTKEYTLTIKAKSSDSNNDDNNNNNNKDNNDNKDNKDNKDDANKDNKDDANKDNKDDANKDNNDESTLTPEEKEEARLGLVDTAYWLLFNRGVDPAGAKSWIEGLDKKQITLAQFFEGVFYSEEYKAKNGKAFGKGMTDEDFIELAYQLILGRSADEAGKNAFLDLLKKGYSRKLIIAKLIESDECTQRCKQLGFEKGVFKLTDADKEPSDLNLYVDEASIRQYVTRLYRVILGRDPDPEGLEYWVNRIMDREQSAQSVATFGFFMSEEYKNFNKSDAAFVTDGYSSLMNRTPDPTGLQYWIDKLTGGMTRWQVMETGFGNSDEFGDILRSFGLKIPKTA